MGKVLNHFLGQWFSTGDNFAPRRHLAMSGDFLNRRKIYNIQICHLNNFYVYFRGLNYIHNIVNYHYCLFTKLLSPPTETNHQSSNSSSSPDPLLGETFLNVALPVGASAWHPPVRPGMLLSTLQCTGRSFRTKTYPVQNVNSGGRLRKPALVETGIRTGTDYTARFYCNSEEGCVRSGRALI